ncbi:MAG: HepT-like ribonuclease domain-containing protein [Pyrinomonadaceae bacterium]
MRDEGLYFDDILEATEYIAQFLQDISREHFMENELLKSAVIQKLTVIGESISRISDSTKERYPSINWKSIKGFRNHAVHVYYELDWDTVWETATNQAALLTGQIAAIIQTDFPMPEDEARGE